MSRSPEPRWYKSRSAWYVKVNGKQYRLGTVKDDRKGAKEAFRAIMEDIRLNGEPTKDRTILSLVDEYLAHKSQSMSDGGSRVKRYCRAFATYVGNKKVSHLKPIDLENFCKSRYWGDGTVGWIKNMVCSVFNWHVKMTGLNRNPFRGIERPRARSRGKECVITPEEHSKIAANCHVDLKPVLEALYHSGARPGEICRLISGDIQFDFRVAVIDKHKNKKKGKSRTIPLNDRLIEILKAAIRRHPVGPLFVNRAGTQWTSKKVNEAFARVRDRLKMRRSISPYSYRHAMATALLRQGVPAARVAKILGNSPTTLDHHYSHLWAGDSENIQAMNLVRDIVPMEVVEQLPDNIGLMDA